MENGGLDRSRKFLGLIAKNVLQLGINNPSVCHSEAMNLVLASERFIAGPMPPEAL